MIDIPLVSVIIPVYNVDSYLCECVNSVLAQTHTNLEVILVDDGSKDRCPSICDSYAAQDSRVRVIHQQNRGLSAARNAGMKIASAEWWTFVDSDDVLHPHMIETLLRPLLTDSSLKVSSCSFYRIPEKYTVNFEEWDSAGTVRYELINLLTCMRMKYWTTACGKLYSRSLFNGIIYPEGRLHEDEFVTYRVLYAAGQICITEAPLYLYRRRESSITANLSEKNLRDSRDALCGSIDFFNNRHETELAVEVCKRFAVFYSSLFIRSELRFAKKQVKAEIRASLKRYINLMRYDVTGRILMLLSINTPRLCWVCLKLRNMF